MHEPPEILLEGVSKVFGPRPEQALERLRQGADRAGMQRDLGLVLAVDDATLEIARGEIFVLMGLSGSGKSTLLRLLNGLHRPTAGRVVIEGTTLGTLKRRELLALRRRKFGMVFQGFALLPHRTVRANVEFGLELQGMRRGERRAHADEALGLVGLSEWAERRPEQLSGGMQQRVGLARALAVSPEILLMDEAFSALDPLIRAELQTELLALQSRMHKTIVFVTHDLDEALRLGDRIAIMRDGAVVQVGTPEEILVRPADDYVAQFVRGVDPTRILTAGALACEGGVAAEDAAPAAVLADLRREGLSAACVVDARGRPRGLVECETLADLAARGEALRTATPRRGPAVDADEALPAVIRLAAGHADPIAVLDPEGGHVRGLISRGSLLAALSRRYAEPASEDGA